MFCSFDLWPPSYGAFSRGARELSDDPVLADLLADLQLKGADQAGAGASPALEHLRLAVGCDLVPREPHLEEHLFGVLPAGSEEDATTVPDSEMNLFSHQFLTCLGFFPQTKRSAEGFLLMI